MKSTSPTLAELIRCPPVAWPTVGLFFLCYGIIGGVWVAGINGTLPLWAGAIINGITAYFLFSVVHDSSHNSLSRHTWINEGLGRIGLVYFAPLAPMDVARHIHMAHHKFANDPVKDPDAYSHKLDWLFPIRWANFDYFYTKFFFQQGGAFAKRKYSALGAYVAMALNCCCCGLCRHGSVHSCSFSYSAISHTSPLKRWPARMNIARRRCGSARTGSCHR
jgi:fatty acid desaturase